MNVSSLVPYIKQYSSNVYILEKNLTSIDNQIVEDFFRVKILYRATSVKGLRLLVKDNKTVVGYLFYKEIPSKITLEGNHISYTLNWHLLENIKKLAVQI